MARLQRLKSHTILSRTVLVDIVTTEEHARLVAIDESVIPASRLSGRGVAKVFLVVRGRIAIKEDMIARVGSKSFGLGDGLTKQCTLSGVARLVNLVFAHKALRPVISAGRLRGRAPVVLERGLRVSRGWEALRSCDSRWQYCRGKCFNSERVHLG